MVLAVEGQRLPLSHLRLQCPAKEQLHCWWPVASRVLLDSLGQPQPLTPAMLMRVEDVLHTAWAPNTAEMYGTSLAAFHWFCDQADLAEVDQAPALHELLEVFASALTGVYSFPLNDQQLPCGSQSLAHHTWPRTQFTQANDGCIAQGGHHHVPTRCSEGQETPSA